ncbi:MAG TPA: hypothetical protein VKA46_27675 [Gemmataceae bacterium]|nr:hypothetical protein [Gemmataceae bacterium]
MFVGTLCLVAQGFDGDAVHLLEEFRADRFELFQDWRGFVKSSRSLIMPSRLSAPDLTVFRHRRWSSVSGMSRTRSVMPRMAFMGVRMSWLTLARNSSLARLAAAAASLAWRSSSSSRLRSEMFWTITMQ